MGQIKSKASGDYSRYTPVGLYERCLWPRKNIKKLVNEKKLGPICKGAEEPSSKLEECPICFLYYPSLNRSSCCKQSICTECFIQLKPTPMDSTPCPFCKKEDFNVTYTGPKSSEEHKQEEMEQKKVREAQERAKRRQLREESRARRRAQKAASTTQETNLRSVVPQSDPQPPLPIQQPIVVADAVPVANPVDGEQQADVLFPQNNLDLGEFHGNPEELEELMLMEAIRLSLLGGGLDPSQAESN